MGNYTFLSYSLVQQLPGVVLSLLATGLASGILWNVYLSWCFCRDCKCVHSVIDWFVDITTNNAFGKILKKQKDGVNNKYITTVFGFKASRIYIYWLFGYLVQVSGAVFLVFWDDFLLEESNDCKPNDIDLTCFSSDASSSDLPLNCSDTHYLEENNITSFTCFKFVFNIGKASGSAVGIFTIANIIVTIITWITLHVSNGKWYRRLCTYLMQCALLAASAALFYVFLLAVPSTLIELLERLHYSTLKIIAVFAILFYCIVIPWFACEKIKDDYNDSDNSSNDELLDHDSTSINYHTIPVL